VLHGEQLSAQETWQRVPGAQGVFAWRSELVVELVSISEGRTLERWMQRPERDAIQQAGAMVIDEDIRLLCAQEAVRAIERIHADWAAKLQG
jgi:hypothetical protein